MAKYSSTWRVSYRLAYFLAFITIFYNLIEGLVSVYFGWEDETISLFGFGVDSFVEVLSGVGVWYMLFRIRRYPDSSPDRFERTALRITGIAFFILAGGLIMTAMVTLIGGRSPETTMWGVVIALVSIVSMWLLIHFKLKVGEELHSSALIADAHCTRACLYLSFVLLVSSLGFALTGIGGIDSLGALVIAWLSFREGREAMQKSRNLPCSCACGDACPV